MIIITIQNVNKFLFTSKDCRVVVVQLSVSDLMFSVRCYFLCLRSSAQWRQRDDRKNGETFCDISRRMKVLNMNNDNHLYLMLVSS